MLIREFFPVDSYGLPSLDTFQEPKDEDHSLFISFDPENIIAEARLQALQDYCHRKNLDLEEFEREYQPVEDGIINLLAREEQRIFLEVMPGVNLKGHIEAVEPIILEAFNTRQTDLDSYKIPHDFINKVRTIVVPRQFQRASLAEIQESLLPKVREESNISREYKDLVEKTGYERMSPRPRGPGRT